MILFSTTNLDDFQVTCLVYLNLCRLCMLYTMIEHKRTCVLILDYNWSLGQKTSALTYF